MKLSSFRPWLLALILGMAVNVYAAPADNLIQAYDELASANHDYKGHRVAAMKQIQQAAKVLGVKLHGEGKNHLKQGISDRHLRAAQGLLSQAAAGLPARAFKHVNAAEKQLSIALGIR
jgi:hypothetical protein